PKALQLMQKACEAHERQQNNQKLFSAIDLLHTLRMPTFPRHARATKKGRQHMPTPPGQRLLQPGVAVRSCAGIIQIRFNRSAAIKQAALSAWLSQAPWRTRYTRMMIKGIRWLLLNIPHNIAPMQNDLE